MTGSISRLSRFNHMPQPQSRHVAIHPSVFRAARSKPPEYSRNLAWKLCLEHLEKRARAEGIHFSLKTNVIRSIFWSAHRFDYFTRKEFEGGRANEVNASDARSVIKGLSAGGSLQEFMILDRFAERYGRAKPVADVVCQVSDLRSDPTDADLTVSESKPEFRAIRRTARFVRLLGEETAAYLFRQVSVDDFVQMVAFLSERQDAESLYRLIEQFPNRNDLFAIIVRGDWNSLKTFQLSRSEQAIFQTMIHQLDILDAKDMRSARDKVAAILHSKRFSLHPIFLATTPYERLALLLDLLASSSK